MHPGANLSQFSCLFVDVDAQSALGKCDRGGQTTQSGAGIARNSQVMSRPRLISRLLVRQGIRRP